MIRRCGSITRLGLLLLLVVGLFFSACGSPPAEIEPVAPTLNPTNTTAVQISPTATSTTTPTTIPLRATDTPNPPPTVWLAPHLPRSFQDSLRFRADVVLADSPTDADYLIDISSVNPVSNWIYVLVAPFPSVPDGVSSTELQDAWQGKGNGSFSNIPLLMEADTYSIFKALWGEAAEGAVEIQSADYLETYAWNNRPVWGIIPFENLNPRWKVLTVDSQSPIHKEFNPALYSLNVPISLLMSDDNLDFNSTGDPIIHDLLNSNREPEKLTTVILTGVTALVRATAETMRRRGITYPASEIGEILRYADITHVSNEVPFTPDCPTPNPKQPDLKFCSNPDYIELLQEIGTDVVELSGDHFSDWGPESMRFTLDLYKQVGMPYYGGGYNEQEARQPLLIEHNGNKLAFLGCNAKGGGYATARGDNPGAVACDFDWLAVELERLVSEGYIPIVTFQHFEYYTYIPQPKLITDFHTVAEDGAVIVSGSQAHQPHGMEFYEGAFLHYGLGNLFFDQFHMGLPTGQAFLDRHVFYDGRHISTELIGIRFVNYALPRLMTPDERAELLKSVFEASGW